MRYLTLCQAHITSHKCLLFATKMLSWVLVAVLVVIIYVYLKRKDKFWRDKDVPYVPAWPPAGNMNKSMFRMKSAPEVLEDLYHAYDSRYVGIQFFFQNTLMIKDLNLIKQIGIKEFDHFSDHLQTVNEDMDPLFGKGLISLKGEKWRNMRSTLSPAFTGSKMRLMFVLMSECAESFSNYFTEILEPDETLTLELKDTCTRFANDIIATTAFGIECNSIKEKDNEFYLMGKDLTNFGFTRLLIFLAYDAFPSLMKWSGIHLFGDKLTNFFRGAIRDTMRSREEQGIVRPDMIHLLMEARKGKLKHEEQVIDEGAGFATVEESNVGKQTKIKQEILSDDDIASQAFLFFFAGFETVSTALCHILYELAINEDIQMRLREEIDETKKQCEGKLNYETLVKLKYLDMVVSEGLRKWPPVPSVERACLNTFTIQPEKPGEVPVTLNKGDNISITVYAMHRDPKYFPNPEKFDPERFSDENIDKITPFSYLPFGIGPRNCIGSRFALLEVKVLVFHMLSKFELVVVGQTEIPLKLSKSDFSMNAANGFWIGLKLRKT